MRYETVKTSFWDEPDFEDWNPDTRLLYLWAMTNPHGHGISGVSRATPKMIQSETGLTFERQEAAFAEMGDRAKRYDGHWIWLRARLTHTCKTVHHWASVATFLTEPTTHVQLAIDFADFYNRHPQFAEFAASHPLPIRHNGSPTPLPPPSHPRRSPPNPTPNPTPTPIPSTNPTPLPSPEAPAAKKPPKKGAEPRVREFEHWWGTVYQKHFGVPYVCQFAADGKQLKDVLGALDVAGGDALAALKAAAERFLADETRREYGGHTIRNFCRQVNRYTREAPYREPLQSNGEPWPEPTSEAAFKNAMDHIAKLKEREAATQEEAPDGQV